MVDALKKLDKKFLIIVGLIILLPILLIIFLFIMQSCNTKITQSKYEARMADAAIKYLKDNKKLPLDGTGYAKVNLDTLVDKGYISSTKKLLDDDTCDGSVVVRKAGTVSEDDKADYNAIAKLECEDYRTSTLFEKVKKSEVTSGPGLYKDGEGYVFKGDSVKNHVTFSNNEYVIVSIDANGVFKLLKTEAESLDQTWDTKYNIQIDESYGKNIFADSNIRKTLNKFYSNGKKVSSKFRSKLVPYSVCIGKRDYNDTSISSEKDCAERFDNQMVSLLNVSDFSKASLDPDCTTTVSKSCRNYNYMKSLNISSWTLNAVSNDTYNVYYLRYGLIRYEQASTYEYYNVVIFIDGNEIVSSGDGSAASPYVIE